MDKTLILFLFLSSLSCSKTILTLAASQKHTTNPFTSKASVLRYWKNHISHNLSISPFLISKASPLSHTQSAFFAKLINQKSLDSHLSAFCSAARLFCLLDSRPAPESHPGDSNFAFYKNKQFSSYGSSGLGGLDQFKNYSDGINFATSAFARYSKGSNSHREGFAGYADDGNVASSNFSSYGSSATGGSGDFKNYMPRVNVPDLRFASYNSDSNGHKLSFSSYSDDTNSGNQAFTSYGKNANAVPLEFTSYGKTSNVVGSTFTGYTEMGNSGNDSFKGYTSNANNPTNSFKNYGFGGNDGIDSFNSYRDSANAGTDIFQSYGKKSNSGKAGFINYGKSFNVGFDTFKEYAKDATNPTIDFKIYGANTTFKDYAKKGVTFSGYTNPGELPRAGGKAIRHGIEVGKFFREKMLKNGTITKMPNIQDWMPKRSFLPRTIIMKLPFSSRDIKEIKRVFHATDNSTMEHAMMNTLIECERAPSPGETKRCIASIEDMIDFATTVLGRDIIVRTTESTNGSSREVMIGNVRGMNGGRVTKSVSCHQSLYPFLLYYCHSVPKVRVYEADILDVRARVRINRGVAICHLDTSTWSASHSAFKALGNGPGRIEVCHWIFENDMTWITRE
ncbi:polygalacturonase 1 beta-like protein 1 [Andrographis paniculata]|uniref:polygalacturonase 1 beta-like protein 1 n=1 Tax=Andrographis paniculata TaxID=175694 RepID=UPI0021E8D508|nr:polygalacturonase 1 beta-like protein 1 [Andrographis paniculata]